MSKLPFMKFYVDDYLADTVRLNAFEHGCYILLIIEYWRNKGPLKFDAKELADICRCDVEEFRKIEQKVLKFFKIEDGFLVHSRIDREMEEAQKLYEKRSLAGSKGGKAKAKLKPSLSRAKAKLKQPEPEPEPEPEEIDKSISLNENDFFEEFWELFPRQRRGNKQKAKKAFERAVKQNRGTEIQIIEGLKKYSNSREVKEGYAKGAEAWINDDRWNDQHEQITTAKPVQEDISSFRRRKVLELIELGSWDGKWHKEYLIKGVDY